MALSFLPSNRTILFVSDEALSIYSTGAKGPRLMETIPWEAADFEKNVAKVIVKDCGRRPVLIVNDMVEQHYRKERVIRGGVGMMDRAGMLKRKLNVAFPNYPIKAAFPLKEKIPKTETTPAADIYILAAVPGSNQFAQTLNAARESLASVSGFCLLPVEASDMLKALSDKISKTKKSSARWVVFMGQHRNGGMRQVVTKNGELALTRMTPVAEDDSNSTVWAQDVHQEFKATMSYLSRFGYQAEDGLDVIVIANSEAGEALEQLIEEDCNFAAMTVSEAARLLSVPVGRQEDQRYVDPLHVAWIGRKNKFILPMKAAQIDQVSKPRQGAMVATLLLLAGAAFMGYQFINQYAAISKIYSELDDGSQRHAQLQVQYQKEVQRKEELGFDVRLVQSSIAVYDQLQQEQVKPLDLFNGVGKALGKDLRLDKMNISRPAPSALPQLLDQATGGTSPVFVASMQMTYPSTTNIDKGNEEVSDLRGRLQSLLPGHKVEVTKFLKDYEYVEEIVVETGDLEKNDVKQDFVAEITIKGPEKKAEEEPVVQ